MMKGDDIKVSYMIEANVHDASNNTLKDRTTREMEERGDMKEREQDEERGEGGGTLVPPYMMMMINITSQNNN